MTFSTNLLRSSILVIVATVLFACGSVEKKVGDHLLKTDISGLELDKNTEPTVLYRRKNAPDISTYNRFIVDPVTIDYRDQNMKEINSEDLARMQNYFQERVSNELKEAGYTITDQPGASTMRISFILSGIKAPSAIPNVIALQVPVVISVGEVTVEAAFRESKSNRVDAVAIGRLRGSRVLNPTPWSTWADVESAFDQWAEGIVEAVNKQQR
jgi:hypothetical protein